MQVVFACGSTAQLRSGSGGLGHRLEEEGGAAGCRVGGATGAVGERAAGAGRTVRGSGPGGASGCGHGGWVDWLLGWVWICL